MSDPAFNLPSDVLAAAERMSQKHLQFALDESIPTSHRPVSTINVAVGPETVQNISLGAASSTSINPSWQITVPTGMVLDSNIQVRLPFRFSFTGTTDGAGNYKVLPDYQWSMSRYAIYQAIQNISVTLDGTSITKSIGDIMPLIADYTDLEDPRSHDLYSCPDTVHNFAHLYAVGGAAVTDAAKNSLIAAGATPFATAAYAHSKYGSRVPVVVDSTDTAAAAGVRNVTYDIDIYMALPWSIFASSGTGLGLGNLRQMRVSMTFNSEWNRLFNYLPSLTGYADDDGPECTNAVFRDNPEIMYRNIKPANYVSAGLADPVTKIPYDQIHTMKQHSHWTQKFHIASGATRNATTTPITLQSVPRRIYVAAIRGRDRHHNGATAGTAMTNREVCITPSTYGSLSNIKISFAGLDANNSQSPFALYEMSCRNGYNLPWSIASKTGFAVCFDLQNDLSLGSTNHILSALTSATLYVNADVTNNSDIAGDFDFTVVVESDSFLEFKAAGTVAITDALSLDDADRAALLKIGSHVIRTSSNSVGGSFLGTIFRGAKKVLSGIPKLAWDNKGKIFDYVKNSLASGMRPNTIGGADAIAPAKAKAKRGAGV